MADNEGQLVSTSWVIFVTLLFSVCGRHIYCALMCKTKNVYNVCWVSYVQHHATTLNLPVSDTQSFSFQTPGKMSTPLTTVQEYQGYSTFHTKSMTRYTAHDFIHWEGFLSMWFFNGWNEGVSILGLHPEIGNTNTKQVGLPALHPLFHLVIQDAP